MFTITIDETRALHVKGSFDFGYAGTYTDDQISFVDTLDEIREWKAVPADASDEEILSYLNTYFNAFQEKILHNIKQVNDNFLLWLLVEMDAVGNEFWKIPALTVSSELPEDPQESYKRSADTLERIRQEYVYSPNDGSMEKSDVEAFIRQNYPMLNLDGLLNAVVPECVCLMEGHVSFQCSDNLGLEILCSAYDELDENLAFTDWHNF